MRLTNHTDVPNTVIQVMLRQVAKGLIREIKQVKVNYTRKIGYQGHVEYSTRIIHVAFPKNGSGLYPVKHNSWRSNHFNFPKYEVKDETENCLVLLAHEVEHLRRHLKGKRNTEQRVEKATVKQLEKWRNKQSPTFFC